VRARISLAAVSFEEASKYISFHSLRAHGHLFSVGPVTEGVYIHAKVALRSVCQLLREHALTPRAFVSYSCC
jgi:hypothetical protein